MFNVRKGQPVFWWRVPARPKERQTIRMSLDHLASDMLSEEVEISFTSDDEEEQTLTQGVSAESLLRCKTPSSPPSK